MISLPAQQPTQPTKTSGQLLEERVLANAAIIWPGEGRIFDIEHHTDDYEEYYGALHELCGAPGESWYYELRTITGLHPSIEQSARALDEKLQYMARVKLAVQQQPDRAGKRSYGQSHLLPNKEGKVKP
jgi:hypothetical protein